MGLRDLDDRVLGQRGLVAVAAALAVASLVGGIAAVVRSDIGTALFAFLVFAWAGFWALRRWRSLGA